jgi:hypothetical protein
VGNKRLVVFEYGRNASLSGGKSQTGSLVTGKYSSLAVKVSEGRDGRQSWEGKLRD